MECNSETDNENRNPESESMFNGYLNQNDSEFTERQNSNGTVEETRNNSVKFSKDHSDSTVNGSTAVSGVCLTVNGVTECRDTANGIAECSDSVNDVSECGSFFNGATGCSSALNCATECNSAVKSSEPAFYCNGFKCVNGVKDDHGNVNCGLNEEEDEDEEVEGAYSFADEMCNPVNCAEILSPETDFFEFDFEEQNQSADEERSESSVESLPESPRREVFSSTKNDLGGEGSGVARNCFVHSLSFQNLVSSPKYHNCLKNNSSCGAELHHSDSADSDSANMEACGERLLRRESSLFNIPNEAMDCEDYNLQSALLSSFGSKLGRSKTAPDITNDDRATSSGANKECTNGACCIEEETIAEKCMIWSEMEACTRQVTQIGRSACGATAVINVLMALNIPYDKVFVEERINTQFRAEGAPVAQYLLSRSIAGTTEQDLIQGICDITNGTIFGRFFHMHPARDVHLLSWLSSWIAKGVVPIATLNLQCGLSSGQSIPDAWHHQMVFGVGPKGVYLTNPYECVSTKQIRQQLCSESVLLIRRNDIVNLWDGDYDLSPLIVSGSRWRDLNVVGQVINVLREATSPWIPGHRRYLTTHVKIPAAYKSGITLFVRRDSETYKELAFCSELPLLDAE